MRRYLFISLLFVAWKAEATVTFTEFYTDALNGSNLNACDNKTNTTSTGGWDSVTSSFTAGSGTPFSGVAVGDFGTVYVTGKSSASYLARVDSIGGGGSFLIFSATAVGGVVPTTAASGVSCTVGGVCRGPGQNADASFFPINVINSSTTDPAGDPPCLNMKNNAVYQTTVTVQHTVSATLGKPIRFEGYTSTPHDGGMATLTMIANAQAAVLQVTGNATQWVNLIFNSTSTSTNTSLLNIAGGSYGLFKHIVVKNSIGPCFSFNGGGGIIDDFELYNCNRVNAASVGSLSINRTALIANGNIHDSPGSNTDGIRLVTTTIGTVSFENVTVTNQGNNCINDATASGGSNIYSFVNINCNNNGADGLHIVPNASALNAYFIMNSNFVNNGGYAFNLTPSNAYNFFGETNGFYHNTQGISTGTGLYYSSGDITYTANPFLNPGAGNFTLISGQGLGTGFGTFVCLNSTASFTSYPDLGAAQAKRFPGGALTISH